MIGWMTSFAEHPDQFSGVHCSHLEAVGEQEAILRCIEWPHADE